MSVELIVVIALITLLALLAAGTPVAFTLAGSGALGILLLQGVDRTSSSLAAIPFDSTARYSWLVIPLFIFLGMVAVHGHIAEDLFGLAARLLKWLPGGLGLATVATCAGFAAISGSSLATAATVGRLSIGEMTKHGYRPSFAAGIVAASGTLGVMIPPSIILVVYAIISRESVASLLAAGIIPGIVSALIYLALILMLSRRKVRRPAPIAGGSADSGSPTATKRSAIERMATAPEWSYGGGIRAAVLVAIIFMLVALGIYEGIVTVTESAALGGLICMILVPIHLYIRGERKGMWKKLWAAASESASLTSMVFAIVVGASVFTFFLVLAGVPGAFAGWVLSLDIPPLMIVTLLLLMLLPLGMFLEPISILLIVVPLAHPAVVALGYEGVWFGILAVKMIELSFITPPVGLNVFVVAGSSKEVTVEQAFRGIIPFGLADLATLGLFLVFPEIIMVLPRALQG